MFRRLLVGFILLASFGGMASPISWREAFRKEALPTRLLEGAKELPDSVYQDLDIRGQALFFFTAEEMESDLDEFSLDLYGDRYGKELHEILMDACLIDADKFQAFLDAHRAAGFDEVVVANQGIVVFHFTDTEGRRHHLLVPFRPSLHSDLSRLFELDMPDLSKPFLGLLEGDRAPYIPEIRTTLPPLPTARSPVREVQRAGLMALHRGRQPAAAIDLRYLPFLPARVVQSILASIDSRLKDNPDELANIDQYIPSRDPEVAALAASILLKADPARRGDWPSVQAIVQGLREPRIRQVVRGAICGIAPVPVALLSPSEAQLVEAVCGKTEIAPLVDIVIETGDSESDFPSSQVALAEVLLDRAPALRGWQAVRIARFVLSPKRRRLPHRVELLAMLARDRMVLQALPSMPRPTVIGRPMADWLNQLLLSPLPAVRGYAALALHGRREDPQAIWMGLVSGLSDERMASECLGALRIDAARFPARLLEFARGLRHSGDLPTMTAGAMLNLTVLRRFDRKELIELLPRLVDGLSRPQVAAIAIPFAMHLKAIGAEELLLQEIARAVKTMGADERTAAALLLLGLGRAPDERVVRLALASLGRDDLRPLATFALATALHSGTLARRGLESLLTPASAPDEVAVTAAKLLATNVGNLDFEERGAVVLTLGAALNTAPVQVVDLVAARLMEGDMRELYWWYVASRHNPRLRAVMARLGK